MVNAQYKLTPVHLRVGTQGLDAGHVLSLIATKQVKVCWPLVMNEWKN
jgi:hypothetical protein